MKTHIFATLMIGFYLTIGLVSCTSDTQTSPVTDDRISSSEVNGKTETDDAGVNPSQIDLETERSATQPWNITFVTKAPNYSELSEQDYWSVTWRGMEKAAQDFGVNVELAYIRDPCENELACIEAQIELMSQYLNDETTDAMIVAPMDANRLVPVTEKMIDRGIPIIALDSAINTNQVLSLVSFNNFQAGKVMGEWLVEKLDNDSNVVILEGVKSQRSAIDRRNGFLAGLEQGNINVLDSQSALWDTDMAEKITTQWLEQYSDIDAIMCANDTMALGALRAVQKAGRNDILITGYDAIQDVIEAIAKGEIAATIDQSPDLQARIALQMMVRYLETGESLPSIIYMPDINLVTQETIQSALE